MGIIMRSIQIRDGRGKLRICNKQHPKNTNGGKQIACKTSASRRRAEFHCNVPVGLPTPCAEDSELPEDMSPFLETQYSQ